MKDFGALVLIPPLLGIQFILCLISGALIAQGFGTFDVCVAAAASQVLYPSIRTEVTLRHEGRDAVKAWIAILPEGSSPVPVSARSFREEPDFAWEEPSVEHSGLRLFAALWTWASSAFQEAS